MCPTTMLLLCCVLVYGALICQAVYEAFEFVHGLVYFELVLPAASTESLQQMCANALQDLRLASIVVRDGPAPMTGFSPGAALAPMCLVSLEHACVPRAVTCCGPPRGAARPVMHHPSDGMQIRSKFCDLRSRSRRWARCC